MFIHFTGWATKSDGFFPYFSILFMQRFVYRFCSSLILCFVLFFMTNFNDPLYLSFPGSLEYIVCHIINRFSRYQY